MDYKKYLNKTTIALLVAILFVAGYGLAYYYFQQYRNLTKDPNTIVKKETAALVTTVSKLILLPEGESPAVATVQDKEKLANEPFFKNAQNGDKVLIYYAARKAFLYRPSTNQIIDTAPLNVENAKTSTTTTTSTSTTTAE